MFSFAIDPSKNVMTPKDPSVTSAGNDVLSPGDIVKLQCLYNCDGTSQGTCGGHFLGDSGVVESSGPITFTSSGTGKKVCKWLITATFGDAIELSYQSFNVLCGKGELRVYDGKDDTDNRREFQHQHSKDHNDDDNDDIYDDDDDDDDDNDDDDNDVEDDDNMVIRRFC